MISPFCVRSETYLALRDKPRQELVASLRNPSIRAAILDEYDASEGSGVASVGGDPLPYKVSENFENMWIMEMNGAGSEAMTFDYEPTPESSIASLSAASGVRPQEILLDAMIADEGRGVVWYPYVREHESKQATVKLAGSLRPPPPPTASRHSHSHFNSDLTCLPACASLPIHLSFNV